MPLLGRASVADDPRTAVADRPRSARAAATVAATAGRGEEALRRYRTAVSLIAQLTPRAPRRDWCRWGPTAVHCSGRRSG
ncbi:hypothetical protein ACFYYH_22830 [Streptomyces sp. NPDC002018]|uniref:hypothetical protein n=1 Tax=Streptomyces sp. NPDC002018 TaxID=3364629 RepID=UPI0036B5E0EB